MSNLVDYAKKELDYCFPDKSDNSTAFNIEGKVFVDEDGLTYTSRESNVPITFPYEVPDKPEFVKEGEN